jgi:hypothetical protein
MSGSTRRQGFRPPQLALSIRDGDVEVGLA